MAREQSVYNQESWRVDLLLNPSSLTQHQILVEMKAQTAKQTAATFMFEVEKDLIKLNEGRRNIYVTSGAFMLAVTIDKAADDGMSRWKPDDANYIFNRVVSTNGTTFQLAFADSEGDWRPADRKESVPKVGTSVANQAVFGSNDRA